MDPEATSAISLHFIDWFIIAAYLVTLTVIGYVHSRKQKDLKDFFLASKSMKWIPIGISLMAALNSGMDYVAQPSAIIKFGAILIIGSATWLFLYPYVFYITMPFYRRLDVYSVYEYLEKRFNSAVRTLTALIFMLWRLGWMATALYVPCLALSAAVGKPEWIVPMVIILGIIVTFYTMMGGIKAVIWTDVTQFCIMFGGLAATICVILYKVPGGLPAIWNDIWAVGLERDAMKEVAGTGAVDYVKNAIFIPITWWGLIISGLVSRVTTYTSDQVMVQRFQTTKSIKDARQGFLITVVTDTIWMVTLAFIGLALFTYYFHGNNLPAHIMANTDNIFPYFMAEVFPIGVAGLVIAAIIAASLSSIDSALNSMSTVCMFDFIDRLHLKWTCDGKEVTKEMERAQILIGRLINLILGLVGITLACNVAKLGTIFEIGMKLIVSFTGPILGIFLLGMFTRRANSAGVFISGILGTLAAFYCIFWSTPDLVADFSIGFLFPDNIGVKPLSFMWPPLFGFIVTYFVGYAISLMGRPEPEAGRWIWKSVMQQELKD